jgi:hypothetical protein
MYFVKPNNFLLIVTLLFFNFSFKVFAVEKLDGAWFECEFSGKTSQPTDNCEMLDNDGFIFSNNIAAHISVIDSQETNCKKNKIGQCFQSNISFITVRQGRKDKVKFEDSKLILTFLGCGQVFYLTSKIDYIQAKPDTEKCFWAGKKIFYLKKYNGKLIFKK